MSPGIFLLVLGAALLHALWNAIVKGGADKTLNMAAVVIGQGLCGLALFGVVPAPALASWPYLLAGLALHLGYQLFLLSAYRHGDLTHVYPIARGSAPLIVAAVSAGFLGVTLGRAELGAILLIAIGIISLGLVRRQDGTRNRPAALYAVGTGVFIAAYSLVDGYGARVAGTALGFYSWLAAANAVVFLVLAAPLRPTLLRGLPGAGKVMLVGGGASFAAYAMVVYAFTQAPIALVTALRETSIVFALLIGVLALNERLNLAKLLSVGLTLAGAALLRLARY